MQTSAGPAAFESPAARCSSEPGKKNLPFWLGLTTRAMGRQGQGPAYKRAKLTKICCWLGEQSKLSHCSQLSPDMAVTNLKLLIARESEQLMHPSRPRSTHDACDGSAGACSAVA